MANYNYGALMHLFVCVGAMFECPRNSMAKASHLACLSVLQPAATPRRSLGWLAVLLSVGFPASANAHVKWFTATNVHDAPHPLFQVLTPAFLVILSIAVILVFLGFLLDGWIAQHWPKWLSSGISNAETEQLLVRAATGASFICASDMGVMILTPELRSDTLWIHGVQFLGAMFLLWRPTCVLSGLGILLLYSDAIDHYGIFHLTDYVFFPCLAVYLIALPLNLTLLNRLREPMLVAGLAFSLAWTAIEKFLYPQWTYAVVAKFPAVGMGVATPLVTMIAGFVEFTLAFYIVTGRGLLRLGGIGYALIFVAAMPVFGRLDVFGHLTIVAVFAIVILRGTTPMQMGLHLKRRGIVADSAWIVSLYLLSLVAFFAMYYGMQRT